MGLFPGLGTFNGVQNLVPTIHARSDLMLADKQHRIIKISDDASVHEPKLRREIELNRHLPRNGGL